MEKWCNTFSGFNVDHAEQTDPINNRNKSVKIFTPEPSACGEQLLEMKLALRKLQRVYCFYCYWSLEYLKETTFKLLKNC